MNSLIIIFGFLMLLAGGLLIVRPEMIFNILRDNADKLWLHIGAVLVRLLLGMLLIYQANASRFPIAIEVIGWIAVLAAIVFTMIGRNNFKRLISWAFSLAKPFSHVGGGLALCFGGFLIYAFI